MTDRREEKIAAVIEVLRRDTLYWEALDDRDPSDADYRRTAERVVDAVDTVAERPETEAERRAAHMRRLVEADATETVYPRGVPTQVPRGLCRCPVLNVGDFCPVHGG